MTEEKQEKDRKGRSAGAVLGSPGGHPDLPRGVLSEDGIYNVLEKYKELKRQLKQEDL